MPPLGLGITIFVNGPLGGVRLWVVAATVTDGATSEIAQLRTNLKGSLTFTKLSGSSNVSIDASTGQISLGAVLGPSESDTFVARAANTTGDAIEKSFTLTGAGDDPNILTGFDGQVMTGLDGQILTGAF